MKRILLFTTVTLMTLMVQSQTFQWANMFSSTGQNQGLSLVIGPSGNLYVGGNFEGTVDFDPGNGIFNLTSFGASDAYIAKLDLNGKLIWAKQLGGSDKDRLIDIRCDANENIYVTGNFSGVADMDPGDSAFYLQSHGRKDIFLTELDARGNFIWAGDMGGKSDDYGTSVFIAPSGNIYLAGYFLGTSDFDPVDTTAFNLTASDQDIFVEKFDKSHNFVWAKAMGGPQFDYGISMCLDEKENVYTTGLFKGKDDFDPGDSTTFYLTSAGPYGTYDMYISKLNSSGEFVWARQISGQQNETGTHIIYDYAGNLYFTGYFQGKVDFDPDTGTLYMTSFGGFDAFVGKMNVNGHMLWAEQIGGLGNQYAQAVSLDKLGDIYLTGLFEQTADFDPGEGVFELTSAGDYDIYVSKLNATGGFVWAARMGGAYYDRGYDVVADSLNNAYTTGYFKGTVDFDPDPNTYFLTGKGESDAFVSKLGPEALGVEPTKVREVAAAFPNPVQDILNIKLEKSFSRVNVTVFDMQGREILNQSFGNMNTIPLRIQAVPGMYFVKITTEEGAYKTIKIIKR